MNPEQDFDDRLRGWAELGDEHLPARYLDAALAQIETTPQRGAGWWPLKGLFMNRKPVATLAFFGVAALVVGLAIGRFSQQDAALPSATALPTATTSPAPSLAGQWLLDFRRSGLSDAIAGCEGCSIGSLLTFRGTGEVFGISGAFAGCDSFTGSYAVAGSLLQISIPPPTINAGCYPRRIQEIHDRLNRVVTFVLADCRSAICDELTLLGREGNRLLVYRLDVDS